MHSTPIRNPPPLNGSNNQTKKYMKCLKSLKKKKKNVCDAKINKWALE